jgi:hypothetical protein
LKIKSYPKIFEISPHPIPLPKGGEGEGEGVILVKIL